MGDIEDYAALFRNQTPLIDTRAPVEFHRGSLPTATNLPLMDDMQRDAVGRCYAEQGPDAAVTLGHQLVSGALRETRTAAWLAFAQANPGGALFCFRGGLRSELVQQWLKESGVDYPRIRGGYKALRRWLMDHSASIYLNRPFIVVAGKTGCAKTRLINEGASGQRLPGSVDLEGLANHRGSSFGRRDGGQPNQLNFEIAVDLALFSANEEATGHIIAEDESRLIGRCALPHQLKECLGQSPLVVVEADLGTRVEHSFENYILANLADLEARLGPGPRAFEEFASGLHGALDRIRKRLGGAQHGRLSRQLTDAIESHRAGDGSDHRIWIEGLLKGYYDPMYNYQLEGREGRILFRGDESEVAGFLRQRQLESTHV